MLTELEKKIVQSHGLCSECPCWLTGILEVLGAIHHCIVNNNNLFHGETNVQWTLLSFSRSRAPIHVHPKPLT